MGAQITTIFLSMALVTAIRQFASSQQTIFHWLILFYFILNNIRYFYGDIKFSECDNNIKKDVLGFEQVIDVHLYVITRFLIVVLALFIDNIEKFLWIFAGSQIVGVLYLFFTIVVLLDPTKDTNEPKKIPILWHWLWFNVAEIALAVVMVLLLTMESDLKVQFKSLTSVVFKNWVLGIGFGLLFFIQIIDWALHQKFLFAPSKR